MTPESNVASVLFVRSIVADGPDTVQQCRELAPRVIRCTVKLLADLKVSEPDRTEEQLQSIFYEAGKLEFASDLRLWFKILYEMLLKKDSGPRLGQFTMLVGKDWITNRLTQIMEDPFAI